MPHFGVAQPVPGLGWTLCQPASTVRALAPAGDGYFLSGRIHLDCSAPVSFIMAKHSYDGKVWWTKTYAHEEYDRMLLAMATYADGSALLTAYEKKPADTCHYLLIKADPAGDTVWIRKIFFSASAVPPAARMIPLSDGGALLAAAAESDNLWDVLLMRFDASGNTLWSKTFGGTEDDYAADAVETADGFTVIATTASADGDVTGQHGLTDIWIIKVDGAGNLLWSKCLGGSGYEHGRSIATLADGSLLLAGNSTSNDGDVSGHHGSNIWYDYWVVKLTATGTLQWQKSLGGTQYDVVTAALPVNDTTVVIAGTAYSADGDVEGHYGSSWYGDFWVAGLNLNGTLLWNKSYGGTSYDLAYAATVLPGGWVLVGGNTLSSDGNVTAGCVLDSCYQIPAGWMVKFHTACATPPMSNFTYVTQGPGLIKFLNGSQNAATYLWDFGDGETGTGKNPLHQYVINQNVVVSLKASNSCTYDISCQQVSTCSPLQPDFTFSNTGLTVNFTASTPLAAEVFWDFGDGQSGTGFALQHTYGQPGDYPVTLTATDSCGNTYPVSKTVSTCSALQAAFSVTTDNNQAFFQDMSAGNPNAWLWNFGDGNTSTVQHPVHTFSGGNSFTVCLTVSHSNCPANPSTTCQSVSTCTSSTIAKFSVSSHDNKITFTNQSTNADNFFWDFGDGTYSTDANPVHHYPNGLGVYNACLIASDSCGSDTTCMKLYMGLGPVTANFLYAVFGLNVAFTNISTNAVSFHWSFGDGNTSTQMHPFHTYAADGVYQVCLIAWDVLGNSDTFCQNVSTCVDIEPEFSYMPSGLTVSFSDLTANATQWLWDFGDSIYSSFQHPTHTYAADGVYSVCLIATNACGISDTTCKTLKVCGPLSSQFSWSANYLNASFTDQTAGSTSWFWSFGNGAYSFLQHPSVSYGAAGTYNVCLSTSNVCGAYSTLCQPVTVCAPVVADFNWTVANLTVNFANQTPATVQWNWSFGDGNTSTLENPVHTYAANGTYTITLITANACGYADTLQKTITVCAPLTATFTEQANLLTVTFTPNAPNASSYVWYLGDGNISYSAQPTHTYAAPGNYAVCLVVSDICNNAYQYCKTITVCTTLTAAFSTSTFYLTTFFNDLTSGAVGWNWDFGDGNTSTVKNPMYTYAANGVYNACLTATDACGKQDTACKQLTVCSPLVAAFTYGASFLDVSFSATTPTAVAWTWHFGDGSTSTDKNPNHTYQENGKYDVCLIVTDLCGNKDTLCQQLTVCAPLTADFTWEQNHLTVDFTNLTPNTLHWLWDFGDGSIAMTEHPTHTYPAMGTYQVCLIVFDLCTSDTLCQEVVITCPPFSADFFYNISNLTVTFFDQSPGSIGWQWDFGDGSTATQKNPVHTYADTGIYTVCLISRDSCSADTLCKNLSVFLTGTAGGIAAAPGIFAFPNPASHLVQIVLLHAENGRLQIRDVLGQIRWQTVLAPAVERQSINVPVGTWPPGTYLIELQSDGLRLMRQLVVQ